MISVFNRRNRAKAQQSLESRIAALLGRLEVNLVLDVGANIGQTGLRLRNLGYRGRIVSFEAVPEAYEALLAAAVDDPEWYVASRAAVGDSLGVLDFHIAAASDLSSGLEPLPILLEELPDSRVIKTRRVAETTIEEAMKSFGRPDDRILLKIDVQGMEDKVLDGVGTVWPKIFAVQLQMSLIPLYKHERSVGYYIDRLTRFGFEPWLLAEQHFSTSLFRQLRLDGLFVRPG